MITHQLVGRQFNTNEMSEVRRGPSSPSGASTPLTAHHHTSPQLLKQLTSPPVVSATSVAANFAAMVSAAAATGGNGGGTNTPYVLTPSVSGRSSPSVSPSPVRKKLKLDVDAANAERDIGSRRKRLAERRQARLTSVTNSYKDNMFECFFLQSEGNIVDLPTFRRKPNQMFLTFLSSQSAPERVIDEVRTRVLGPAMLTVASSSSAPIVETPPSPLPPPRSVSSAAMAAAVTARAAASGSPLVYQRQQLPSLFPPYSPRAPLMSPVRVGEQLQAFSGLNLAGPSTPKRALAFREQLAEKVRQEAWVTRRVNELTREGLWSEKRLPKVCEKPRVRTQWDVLLQEMRWLAVDFYQERQWKKAAAKMLAESAKAYVESMEERRAKIREAKERRIRKVAGFVSDQVMSFWNEAATEALVNSAASLIPDCDEDMLSSNHVTTTKPETHSEENPSVSATVSSSTSDVTLRESTTPNSEESELKSYKLQVNENNSKNRLTDLSFKRSRMLNHLSGIKTNLSTEIGLLDDEDVVNADEDDKDFTFDIAESDNDDESTINAQVIKRIINKLVLNVESLSGVSKCFLIRSMCHFYQ